MIELMKSLKYDDLITVDRMSIYKLVWKTNYNMVEDYWMFDEILNHNKLNVWIKDNNVRIERTWFNCHSVVTNKITTIDIQNCSTQDLIDYKNCKYNYVERIINELGNKI